jgi:hypothetical protein
MESTQILAGQVRPILPVVVMTITVMLGSWLAGSWSSFWLSLFAAAMSCWATLLVKATKPESELAGAIDTEGIELPTVKHKTGLSENFARLCINQVDAPIRNIDQVRTLLNRASIELWSGLRKTKSSIGWQEKEVGAAGALLLPSLNELKLDLAKSSGAFCGVMPKIDECKKLNQETYEQIETLSSHLEEIDKQIDALNWISDQTNLLAVNAQIEAARLGKDAKGFHVIASEVHSLADRSRSVSKEVEKSLGLALQVKQSMLGSCVEAAKIDFSESSKASSHVEAAIGNAGNLETRVNELLSVLAEANSQLTQNYEKTVSVMQFDDITKQVLDRSYKDLSTLRTTLRDLSSSEASNQGGSASPETKVAEMRLEQYEIEAVHKPSQEDLAPGEIELF